MNILWCKTYANKITYCNFASKEYSAMFSILVCNPSIYHWTWLHIPRFISLNRFCFVSYGANLLFIFIYNFTKHFEGYRCFSCHLMIITMFSKIYILKIYLNAIYMIVILYFVVSDKCNTFNYNFIIFIPSIFEVCA